MLRFLFPRLTADPKRGADLFNWVTAQARLPHWYVAGEVADNVEGRFAMLATIAALVSVRLERAGAGGVTASVALTERFIEVMESEHREMGLGDPKLGRTVRKLVGSLARRVRLWRAAVDGGNWTEAARESVYGQSQSTADALDHTASQLKQTWLRLEVSPEQTLFEGAIE